MNPYTCGVCGKVNLFSDRASFEVHAVAHANQAKADRDEHARLLRLDGWDDSTGRWVGPGRDT